MLVHRRARGWTRLGTVMATARLLATVTTNAAINRHTAAAIAVASALASSCSLWDAWVAKGSGLTDSNPCISRIGDTTTKTSSVGASSLKRGRPIPW